MADARQLLGEALAQLDATTKLERHEVAAALEPIAKMATEAGATIDELQFEQIAAELALYEEPYVWETFYGPWLTQETANGRLDRPSLDGITPACIDYWTMRMKAAQHPALRARYGDLVWDLSLKVTNKKPPIEAAYIAIDGYVDAIATGRCEPFEGSGHIQKRALTLAASVDAERLRKAVPRLQQYAAAPSESEERDRRQLELFGILTQIRGNRRPAAELQSLAADLRTRLDELDTAKSDKFTIGDIALPLADYYWSSQQPDEAKTVLRIWGAAVERLANETTMSMLASGWLSELHEVYQRYEMHDEARELVGEIEAASAGIEQELIRVSHSTTIPQEEWDKVVDDLTSGTKEEVLRKLAVNFLPRVDDAERLVKEIGSNAIYMNLTQQIVAEDGRVTASIGPVKNDLDGHVVQQLGQTMQFYGQLYRPAFEEAVTRLQLTVDDIIAWLAECPLFTDDRLKLLKPAIAAYLNGDWSTAIHVAIPQIEHALRQVLVLCGQPLTRPHRNGTFLLKNLDEVLRDPATERALPKDVRLYLRTLLCDQRGLNIRNNVCHGLWGSESFNWFTADRVIHAVLVLGLLRPSAAAGGEAPLPNEGGE